MTDHETFAQFKQVKIFDGIQGKALKKLYELSREKTLKKDETVCRSSDLSEEIYFLLDGELQVRTATGPLATIKPFGSVGEMGVITGMPRSADVVASEPSLIRVLGKADFLAVVAKEPAIGLAIYRNIIVQLSEFLRHENLLIQFYEMVSKD